MKLIKGLCILLTLCNVEVAFAQFKSKINNLKNSLEQSLGYRSKVPQNLDSLKSDVLLAYEKLKEYFGSLQEQFDKTRNFLIKNNLPTSVIKRHDDFIKEYRDNKKQLFKKIDLLLATTNLKSYSQKAKNLIEELERQIQEPRYYPGSIPAFIPLNLKPQRLHLPPPQQREKEAQEIYEKYYRSPPASKPSREKIPPEIQAAAKNLHKSPLYIYTTLINDYHYIPYLGPMKDPVKTMRDFCGNDYDLARLLVLLLRASGFPARYVIGAIELDSKRLCCWLGVKSDRETMQILDFNGIPYAVVQLDGKKYFHIEHCWVEVYIPYSNYRGKLADNTKPRWIPLDPSFKKYYIKGENLAGKIKFDIDGYLSRPHNISAIEYYERQIIDKFGTETYITNSLEKGIILQNFTSLPQALPYKVLSVKAILEDLPERVSSPSRFSLKNPSGPVTEFLYRHEVEISLKSSKPHPKEEGYLVPGTTIFSYTKLTGELANKKIDLFYVPATDEDRKIIEAYGGFYEALSNPVCGYLEIKPILMVEGEEVCKGEAMSAGKKLFLEVTYRLYVGSNTLIEKRRHYPINSGEYHAINVDIPGYAEDEQEQAEDRLIKTMETFKGDPYHKDVLGEFFHIGGLMLSNETEWGLDRIGNILGLHTNRLLFQSVLGQKVRSEVVFKKVLRAIPAEHIIDARVNVAVICGLSADERKKANSLYVLNNSWYEGVVFDELYEEGRGISGVLTFQLAKKKNLEVFQINNVADLEKLKSHGVFDYICRDERGIILYHGIYHGAYRLIKEYLNQGMRVKLVSKMKAEIPKLQMDDYSGIAFIAEDVNLGIMAIIVCGGISQAKLSEDVVYWNWLKRPSFLLPLLFFFSLLVFGIFISIRLILYKSRKKKIFF